MEYTSHEQIKSGRCQDVTGWIQNDQVLDPTMPKNFPGNDLSLYDASQNAVCS